MNPFVGEIRAFGFNFPPSGWAACNGQLMAISQNAALFSILGTTFGGNGTSTFGLPNLQGQIPMHWGTSAVGNTVLGEVQGTDNVTISSQEMPIHRHTINGATVTVATEAVAVPQADTYLAGSPPPNKAWKTTPTTFTAPFSPKAIALNGSTLPHENCQPYLVINFSISLFGVFPSRN